jgi:hypothetical protein
VLPRATFSSLKKLSEDSVKNENPIKLGSLIKLKTTSFKNHNGNPPLQSEDPKKNKEICKITKKFST